MLVDLDAARAHLRVDSDAEDELIGLYLGAAEESAQQFLNARIYPDQASLAAARAAAIAALGAAQGAWLDAINAARAAPTVAERDVLLDAGEAEYLRAIADCAMTMHGLVLTDDIRAAILLTLGHLYANREDVIAGPGSGATELPQGARALLAPRRAQLGV